MYEMLYWVIGPFWLTPGGGNQVKLIVFEFTVPPVKLSGEESGAKLL